MGYPPLGGGNKTSPLLGFLPLGEVSIRSADGISPTQRRQYRHAHGPFSIVLRESNPPLWDFPTRSPHYAAKNFPSQSPRLMLCFWDFLHSKHKHYPMGFPRMNLWANEHIHPSIFRSEISPTRETTPMWDIPTRRITPMLGLPPLGGVGSLP